MTTAAHFVEALNRGNTLAAAKIGRALVATHASIGDQWRGIAQFAAHAGEWSLAIDAARLHVARSPGDVERALFAADMLAQAGRLDEAVALVSHYLCTAPNDARLYHLHGTALLELGQVDAGLNALYRAVAIWPASGMSWLAIAGATDYRADPAARTRLEAAVTAMPGADPSASAAWLYAIGKARSDAGEHDGAFAAYAAGARLVRPDRPYDRASDLAEARAIVAACDVAWLKAAHWAPTANADAPIFVTGLPRSGTTLVEQILASHSGVSDGGELNLIGRAAEVIGGDSPDVLYRRLAAASSPAAAWQPFRARYRHLLAERVPGVGRALDKSLNTSRHAALIHASLGDSPLVWLRRDSSDTAWSAFRTFFATGLGWSFDLGDMGHHFAVEDLLFDHWRGVFGDRMLVVPYAELVADADAWIARILAHCGLAMEPGVARFHEMQRAVKTASVAQVREPIYTRAVGSSAVQAAALTPFETSYQASRTALGLG